MELFHSNKTIWNKSKKSTPFSNTRCYFSDTHLWQRKRYITPRECARLQSFPEDFKIDELDKNSYKQFGNAVNVDNVHTVIKATFDHYNI